MERENLAPFLSTIYGVHEEILGNPAAAQPGHSYSSVTQPKDADLTFLMYL